MGKLTPAVGSQRSIVVQLPLGDAASTFNLEKAVCSHGLFMLAPNYWDPLSQSLQRPLRLSGDCSADEISFIVRISHPSDSPHALHLRVFNIDSLSPQHHRSLLAQVCRMLRLSEEENRQIKAFQELCEEAKQRGFGRVFRSPTLFEDMVKCILLCNCQWSRTLSMAKALCELKLEQRSSSACLTKAVSEKSQNQKAETSHLDPKTPAGRDLKRKRDARRGSRNFKDKFAKVKAAIEGESLTENACHDNLNCFQGTLEQSITDIKINDIRSSECVSYETFEDFPSPEDLAYLDEKFLAKCCNLGYRAARIVNLARGIVEGSIQLKKFEEVCSRPSLFQYNDLAEQLKRINGFGPFTCANVLMCMGFYHVVPADSETMRHLKQVHSRNSTAQTIEKDVESIYAKYKPYQFLAYWSEVWHFYEEWFGKTSNMSPSDYKLITAANMKPRKNGKVKHLKNEQGCTL